MTDTDKKKPADKHGDVIKGVFQISKSPANTRNKNVQNKSRQGSQPESAFFIGDCHFDLESGSSSFSLSSGFCVYNITDMYYKDSDQSSQD